MLSATRDVAMGSKARLGAMPAERPAYSRKQTFALCAGEVSDVPVTDSCAAASTIDVGRSKNASVRKRLAKLMPCDIQIDFAASCDGL
jgi:hypothetical protein